MVPESSSVLEIERGLFFYSAIQTRTHRNTFTRETNNQNIRACRFHQKICDYAAEGRYANEVAIPYGLLSQSFSYHRYLNRY